MDRDWMYGSARYKTPFLVEVSKFIDVARAHAASLGRKEIICPCVDCKNKKVFTVPEEIKSHLVKRGFTPDYKVWCHHGELADEKFEDRQQENNDIEIDIPENFGFDLDEMLRHAEPEVLTQSVRGMDNYETLQKAAKDLLYNEANGCPKEFSVLRTVLELLRLKAANGWSDKSFDDLLTLLSRILPNPNLLPLNTYRSKKLICPLSLGVEKIHAYPNHCILYRNE